MMRLTPMMMLMLPACADFTAERNEGYDDSEGTLDTANEPASTGALEALRLDVYAASATDMGLLNQSFFLEDVNTENLDLEIQPGLNLSGSLSGFHTYPTSDIQIPGAATGVSGQLRAFVPNSLMSYAVDIDDDGAFSLDIVAGENYTLAWIPSGDQNLPFEVEEGVPFFESTVINKTLSFEESKPIYGRVEEAGGLGIPGVSVQAVDVLSGIGNASQLTNNMGAYYFRLYPGSYELRFSGNSNQGIPNQNQSLLVSDTSVDGESESPSLEYNQLKTVNAAGQVVNSNGRFVGGVMVRFTAVSLEGYKGASFVTESTTGSNGRYSIPVLPGTYNVEFIPAHNEGFSPYRIPQPIPINADATELDTVELLEQPVVSARVVDIYGEGVGRTLVRAVEQGFDESVFEGYTDELGLFALPVSHGELLWTFVPPNPAHGAIHYLEATPAGIDSQEVQLKEGRLVSGCIEHAEGTVQYAPVELRDSKGQLHASTFTDREGCFEVRVDIEDDSEPGN